MQPKKGGRPRKNDPETISMSEILMGGDIKKEVSGVVDEDEKVLPPPIETIISDEPQTMQRVNNPIIGVGSPIKATTVQARSVPSQPNGNFVFLFDTVFNRYEQYPSNVAQRLLKISPERYKQK